MLSRRTDLSTGEQQENKKALPLKSEDCVGRTIKYYNQLGEEITDSGLIEKYEQSVKNLKPSGVNIVSIEAMRCKS